jgi:hypothetical protein
MCVCVRRKPSKLEELARGGQHLCVHPSPFSIIFPHSAATHCYRCYLFRDGLVFTAKKM